MSHSYIFVNASCDDCSSPPPIPTDSADSHCVKLPFGVTNTNASYQEGEYAAIRWGDGNNHPFELQRLIIGDKDGANAFDLALGYLLGNSPPLPLKIAEDGQKKIAIVPKFTAFLKDNAIDVERAIRKTADSYGKTSNAFVAISVGYGKSIAFECIDPCYVRGVVRASDRSFVGYVVYPAISANGEPAFDAGKYIIEKKDIVPPLPSSTRDLRALKRGTYILHIKDEQLGNPFYSVESWAGGIPWLNMRKNSIDTLQAIYRNILGASFNITIHPARFEHIIDEKEKEKAFEELAKDIIRSLTGGKAVGKSIVSEGVLNNVGDKLMPMYQIDTIEAPDNYSALLEAIKYTSSAAIMFFGLDPTLVGYKEEGKLSSGSEGLGADNRQLARRTRQPRQQVLAFLYCIAIIMGWDVEYADQYDEIGFLDVFSRYQSQNKNGRSEGVL